MKKESTREEKKYMERNEKRKTRAWREESQKRWEEKESEMRLLLEKNQEHSSVLLPFWMYTTFAYQQKHLLLILSSVTSANWLISNISTEAGCQRLTSSLNWTNLTSHTLTLASRLQARCDSLKLEFNAGGGDLCELGRGWVRVWREEGCKGLSSKLDLWWWGSTLIVTCRYSSVIIVQCSSGMVWRLARLSSATSITKVKRTRTELWLMSGFTDWFWLSVLMWKELSVHICVCVCLHVCLQKSMRGARGTLWMLLVWKQISCWQNAKYVVTPLPSVFVLTLLAWDQPHHAGFSWFSPVAAG